MIVLRSGESDLIDLVTCLCLYAVEAAKIRERLVREDALVSLQRFLDDTDRDDLAATRDFLLGLPFSSREVDGFLEIWPGDTVARISDIARHREMFSIDVRRRSRTYQRRRDELWTAQVARGTRDLLGFDPALLPRDRAVHIVSSNTHSVTNCLNPWFLENRDEILAWGGREEHPALAESWENDLDAVYAIARDMFRARPDAAASAESRARQVGQLRLDHTAGTGIRVQLIDLDSIQPEMIDPGISAKRSRPCSDLIVNIDYAFGEQAEFVIRNLLMLYGENVAGVRFFGKAGALVGARGDVLAPTAFVEQRSDLFQPIPSDDTLDALRSHVPGRNVHLGPMLTVDGTLLQNHEMLNFYRRIWGVIGMEMEGTHYYRRILEARELGVIRRDVAFQFYYYVSDLPIEAGSSLMLSAPLALSEGVPPLYGITRHILQSIMDGEQS
jgi:hypothetical protein